MKGICAKMPAGLGDSIDLSHCTAAHMLSYHSQPGPFSASAASLSVQGDLSHSQGSSTEIPRLMPPGALEDKPVPLLP
jgi:hypothetical protein